MILCLGNYSVFSKEKFSGFFGVDIWQDIKSLKVLDSKVVDKNTMYPRIDWTIKPPINNEKFKHHLVSTGILEKKMTIYLLFLWDIIT